MKNWITGGAIVVSRVLGGRSNVFLVSRGNAHILFDTSSRKYQDQLVKNLNKIGVSEIRALVLSHTHFDHVGNAAFIRKKYQAVVLVHSKEASNLRMGNGSIPGGTNFLTRALVGLLS